MTNEADKRSEVNSKFAFGSNSWELLMCSKEVSMKMKDAEKTKETYQTDGKKL